MRASIWILLAVLSVPMGAQMNVPKVGVARYQDGTFHTVQGLPANMIVADLPLDRADAASFSDGGGLIWQGGMVRLLGADFVTLAQYATAEKPVLGIDGGLTSALAWLPSAHTLLHWDGTKFEALDLSGLGIEGRVTDVQSAGPRQARLLVLEADNSVSGVTVSLRTGSLVSSEPLPGVHGYAFGQSFLIVYINDQELVADNLRGSVRSVPLPASDLVMERMSNAWLHLYSPSMHQNWALHLTQLDLNLSILPGLPDTHPPSLAAIGHGRVQQ